MMRHPRSGAGTSSGVGANTTSNDDDSNQDGLERFRNNFPLGNTSSFELVPNSLPRVIDTFTSTFTPQNVTDPEAHNSADFHVNDAYAYYRLNRKNCSSSSCLISILFNSCFVHCIYILAFFSAIIYIYRNPDILHKRTTGYNSQYLSFSPENVYFISHLRKTAPVWISEDAIKIQNMTTHAWDGYLEFAKRPQPSRNGFTHHDNLDPIECAGAEELGDLAVTLIDAADTLATNNLPGRFRDAMDLIAQIKDFDVDKSVSFFEIGIRILGGLISVHLQAVDKLGSLYQGKALTLAVDIGERLFKAFSTNSGLPYNTINLATGYAHGSSVCMAGLGSNLLEFGYLSKLTGNPKYYRAAKKALIVAFRQRSKIGLYGSDMDVHSGRMIQDSSHISAGMDSFFEYLIKSYFVFHDDDLYVIFMEAYRAIEHELEFGGVHITASRTTGRFHVAQIDALELFWPGVQVLIGDFPPAIRKLRIAGQLAAQHNLFPETNSATTLKPYVRRSLQRPELAESIYYMSQAFNDPGLRAFSTRIRDKTEELTRTRCGYAGMRDVDRKNSLEPSQMSFIIAELFKYLYLTVDVANEVNRMGDNTYIMTTEAHPYKVLVKTRKQKFKRYFNLAAELGISETELERKYGMNTRVCSYEKWLRASQYLAFAPAKAGFKWLDKESPLLAYSG